MQSFRQKFGNPRIQLPPALIGLIFPLVLIALRINSGGMTPTDAILLLAVLLAGVAIIVWTHLSKSGWEIEVSHSYIRISRKFAPDLGWLYSDLDGIDLGEESVVIRHPKLHLQFSREEMGQKDWENLVSSLKPESVTYAKGEQDAAPNV